MKKLVILCAVVMMFTLLLPLSVSCKDTTTAARIAFFGHYEDGSGWYIVSMDEDGSGQVELTRWPTVGNHRQSWSRDGTLAYIEGAWGEPPTWLCLVDADGNNQRRLLDITELEVDNMSMAPQGNTVLLSVNVKHSIEIPHEGHTDIEIKYDRDLYAVDVATGTLKRLTNSPDILEQYAVFSPDGRRITFFGRTADPWTLYDVYVMDADGRNQRRLTSNDGSMDLRDRSLQWSPDSREILFSMENVFIDDMTYYSDIFVIDVTKGSLANLTNSPRVNDVQGQWSPDGKKIAFTSGNDADYGVYIMNADGRNVVKVHDSMSQPSWLPDGQRILAVHRVAERVYALVIIDADGKNMKTLVESGDKFSVTYYPIWLYD